MGWVGLRWVELGPIGLISEYPELSSVYPDHSSEYPELSSEYLF